MIYRQLLRQRQGRGQPLPAATIERTASALVPGDERDRWALLLQTLRLPWRPDQPGPSDTLADLGASFAEEGAAALWQAMSSPSQIPALPPCDGGRGCLLDGYGRRLTSRLEAVAAGELDAAVLLAEMDRRPLFALHALPAAPTPLP